MYEKCITLALTVVTHHQTQSLTKISDIYILTQYVFTRASVTLLLRLLLLRLLLRLLLLRFWVNYGPQARVKTNSLVNLRNLIGQIGVAVFVKNIHIIFSNEVT